MSVRYWVREVQRDDLSQLVSLARQFTLLNLPADKKILAEKIERSAASFAGQLPIEEAEYLFVMYDSKEEAIIGSSLIMAKHGTVDSPHSFFKVIERSHVSRDLGIGFTHKVLRFHSETDGPTEIGGLLIDRMYRKAPEKLGKQISLSRFLYMAMFPDRFQSKILCELAPPLTDDGKSEFWEALGRRFTGLPYQEADLLSQSHKEFIQTLFPTGDIYLCLLDLKARAVLGRVGEETEPAKYLLEGIGFRDTNEVDPFDGGPHFAVPFTEALPIKRGRRLKVKFSEPLSGTGQDSLFAFVDPSAGFKCVKLSVSQNGAHATIDPQIAKTLALQPEQDVFVAPFNYSMKKKESA